MLPRDDIRYSVALALTLTACATTPATPVSTSKPASASTPAPTDRFDKAVIRKAIDPFYDSFGSNWGPSWKLSGYVRAEARGRVLYERAFGAADRATGAIANADTSFRVGSVTKQFTSAALLALVEDGKLSLDEKVTDVLPDYEGVNPDATVGQLARHIAGIPSYTEVNALMAERAKPHRPQQLVDAVKGTPAAFTPGTAWSYSNTGYILLGMMIEARSEMSYADYVKKRLFDRAGMSRTVVGDAFGVANRARGYRKVKDEFEAAHPIDLSVAWSAGAVRSTAADLIAWDRALRSGVVLSKTSLDSYYAPSDHVSPFGPYAMGWFFMERAGQRVIAHGGGIDGFTTFYVRVPDDELVVVGWINNGVTAAQKIVQPLLDVVYGDEAPKRSETSVPLSERLLKSCPGTYALTEASRTQAEKVGVPTKAIEQLLTVTVNADTERQQLVIAANGQPPFNVTMRSEGGLMNRRGNIRIRFAPDEGPVRTLVLTQGPLDLEYTRK